MAITKILFVRVDRIGDLVLTLPADQLFNSSNTTWLINEGLGFLPEMSRPKRIYKEIKKDFSIKRLMQLIRWLKAERFTHLLVFHAPWWIGFAAWLARIPHRSGRLSQWHSFVFFNEGYRQSRIAGERSELDYNIELAAQFSDKKNKITNEVKSLQISSYLGESVLNEFGLSTKKYIVIHAGMSGSARNWTIENYASLVYRLLKQSTVVMTGTAADTKWLSPLRDQLKKYEATILENNIHSLIWTDNKLNPSQLIAILENAEVVVAPSTGVIHLAAACGVPVVGLYSPVKSQNALRWGPKGINVSTLTPKVECPALKECLLKKCSKYDCMETLTVEAVLDEIKQKMEVQ